MTKPWKSRKIHPHYWHQLPEAGTIELAFYYGTQRGTRSWLKEKWKVRRNQEGQEQCLTDIQVRRQYFSIKKSAQEWKPWKMFILTINLRVEVKNKKKKKRCYRVFKLWSGVYVFNNNQNVIDWKMLNLVTTDLIKNSVTHL